MCVCIRTVFDLRAQFGQNERCSSYFTNFCGIKTLKHSCGDFRGFKISHALSQGKKHTYKVSHCKAAVSSEKHLKMASYALPEGFSDFDMFAFGSALLVGGEWCWSINQSMSPFIHAGESFNGECIDRDNCMMYFRIAIVFDWLMMADQSINEGWLICRLIVLC